MTETPKFTIRRQVVTMAAVAKEAGVSQSTVSRVLNAASSGISISERTRRRVHDAAARLAYSPNPLARGLRGASTMLLGVIVRDITDPFFAGAIEAISVEAAARGYNVVLGHARGRAAEAVALRMVLETRHVDAILVLGDMTDQPQLIADLASSPEPVVALWQGRAANGLALVNVDNASGIHQALDHLLGLGHRRIAFVGGRRLGDIEERRVAFGARMRSEALAIPAEYLQEVGDEPADGEAAVAALLRLEPRPSAVVCSSDLLAIGILHGAAKLGVHIPLDLSVTGFDDLPIAAFTVPALTTVQMPIREMATRAVEMAIGARGTDPEQVVLPPTFIVRASTSRVQAPAEPEGDGR